MASRHKVVEVDRETRRAEQSVPSFIEHKDKFFSSYSHISKADWDKIFGTRSKRGKLRSVRGGHDNP